MVGYYIGRTIFVLKAAFALSRELHRCLLTLCYYCVHFTEKVSTLRNWTRCFCSMTSNFDTFVYDVPPVRAARLFYVIGFTYNNQNSFVV